MNKYLKAISYNLIYFVISTLAFLILTPLAIRIMGDEFFGLWSIIFAIMQFTNIGTLGIGSIVNKFASENISSDSEVSSIISSALIIVLPMAFITAMLLLSARNVLVDSIKPSLSYSSQFKNAILICAISIVPQFVNKIFQGYFLSQIKNKFVRTMDFVSSIFPLIGGVLISIFKKNLVWLSGWNLFIQVVILFIYLAVTVRRINWNWSPKIPTVKRIFNFSIFMFIESSAITLFQQFDRVLVGMILGPVIAGVYSVATSVGLRMSLITGQITEVMIPYASQKETSGDYQSLLSVYRKLNRYLGIMVVFISTIGIIWMKELLTLWIGKNYADQYSLVFSLIILAYAFLSLTRSGHQTLTGMGKVKFTAINYLCATFVMLLGLIILTRIYGLIGAATANILMVGLFIMNIYAYKLIVNDSAIKSFLEDSLFGLLIPTFSIFIIVFGLPLSIRVLYSLLVIILLFILIMTDKELVGSLKNIQINSFIK